MPPGYKLVPGGQYKTQKPNLRGSKLDHQVLKRLEAKNLSKIAFLIKFCYFSAVFRSSLLKT